MPVPTPESPRPDLRVEFEQLVLPVLPVLYRTARHLAHPPVDPSDLVQETCLRAYRTFANFERGTNVKAWLFTILYSIAANVASRSRRHPEVSVDDLDEQIAGDRADEELALLRHLDAAPHIEAALGQLPDDFRNAVVLVDLEDLTYEEASSVLGCPVGTLRSRLFRGRRGLFRALKDYARETGLLKGGGA
jgi:RNA polymerase sigma-70 factor, ECF subfamily